jgi:hypothetical protein
MYKLLCMILVAVMITSGFDLGNDLDLDINISPADEAKLPRFARKLIASKRLATNGNGSVNRNANVQATTEVAEVFEVTKLSDYTPELTLSISDEPYLLPLEDNVAVTLNGSDWANVTETSWSEISVNPLDKTANVAVDFDVKRLPETQFNVYSSEVNPSDLSLTWKFITTPAGAAVFCLTATGIYISNLH